MDSSLAERLNSCEALFFEFRVRQRKTVVERLSAGHLQPGTMLRLGNRLTLGLLEEIVGGLAPYEWVVAPAPAVGERADRGVDAASH